MQPQRALAHKDSGQCRDDRFGRGESEQRRVDADAVGIALGNDAPILQDDDRPRVAWRRFVRLGEGAMKRLGELRRLRLDDRGPAISGSSTGLAYAGGNVRSPTTPP
jgi:hypothetical protein